jgi:hypothetical protein
VTELSDPHRLQALDAAELLDTPAENVFDRLTDLASRVIGAPVALISLVTADRQFFKSQCGLPEPVATGRQTALSHSFCQYVVTDGDALVVTDAREDPRLASNLAIHDLGVIAYAGVPLRGPDGDVLGSFCAIDDRPRRWTDGDLAVLHELAAATMDVVTLRAEAIAAGAAGRRLQQALVPTPPALHDASAAAIYRSGEQRLLLGGDFFLCEEQPDGSISVLIGDVAGHGADAAAFAISLRSAWRALLLAPAPLAEQVRRLNTVALTQQPDTGVFVTGFFGSIDPDRGHLQALNAGHPPPALLHDAAADEIVLPPCMPLGIAADAVWEAGEIALPPGARLLAYTDGLVEGRREPGSRARLGAPPILDLAARLHAEQVPPADLLAQLVDFAARAHGAALPDDVAALLISTG